MKRRMMVLLAGLALVSGPGCGIFKETTNVVFVREDLTVDGEPRMILKTIHPLEADVTYYDGSKWVIAEDQTIPAGWLIVTPAIIKETEQ